MATASFMVNTPPTAVNDSFEVLENRTLTASVAPDFDAEGHALTYSFDTHGSHGSVVMNASGMFVYTPDADFAGNDSFTYTVTDELGASATGTVQVDVKESFEITGSILEDVDGDANLGDATGMDGAVVRLYLDDGDQIANSGDTLVESVTTGADGNYEFDGLEGGDYWVVVDSSTLRSTAGLNAGYHSTDIWAEQTYAAAGALQADGLGGFQFTSSAGALFGGRDASLSDDASNLATSEHVNLVGISSASVSQMDFGFSFNVVTNVLGGDTQDDDGVGSNGRTVQGSLRQFIANANAIDGANAMRFTPVAAGNANSGSNEWYRIEVTSALGRDRRRRNHDQWSRL